MVNWLMVKKEVLRVLRPVSVLPAVVHRTEEAAGHRAHVRRQPGESPHGAARRRHCEAGRWLTPASAVFAGDAGTNQRAREARFCSRDDRLYRPGASSGSGEELLSFRLGPGGSSGRVTITETDQPLTDDTINN